MAKASYQQVDDLVDALRNVLKAKNDEQYARDHYGGMNWGYHGQEYREKVDAAVEEFTTQIDNFIENRIANYLKENYNMRSIQREDW